MREVVMVAFPGVAIALGALWFAFQFVEPAPPRKITIATGGLNGAYYAFGQQYAKVLDRSGIELVVKNSSGSLENVELLKKNKGGADLALLQGGITNQKNSPHLMSLGRVFLEPVWVFYRDGLVLDRLTDMRNMKVALGSEQSGTRHLAVELLKRNNLTLSDISVSAASGLQAVRALEQGDVDAIFLVLSPKSGLIPRLLRHPDIRLMNFDRAEAYERILPYLHKVVLPQGVFDLAKNIPSRNVELLAASTALVARRDFHPALSGLVAQAASEIHRKGGLFEKQGAFPTRSDPEFQMSSDAKSVYKSGPPFLQRYMPFWLASLLTRMLVMLVPIATIILPLVKIIPILYRWIIRQRLLYWYQSLKNVEVEMAADPTGKKAYAHSVELDRIEEGANNIRTPIAFADQHYELRSAIDLVRMRLEERMGNSGVSTGGFIPKKRRKIST